MVLSEEVARILQPSVTLPARIVEIVQGYSAAAHGAAVGECHRIHTF
jgi:hypothetical protein